MAQESKPARAPTDDVVEPPPKAPPPTATVDSDDEADDDAEDAQTNEQQGEDGAGSSAAKKKKKRLKKKKGKGAATGEQTGLSAVEKALAGLSPDQLKTLLALNPALASELAAAKDGGSSGTGDAGDVSSELLRGLNLEEVMTGLASSGKNVKDMASYKFWATQPVPKFGESAEKAKEEGPLQIQKVEDISTTPQPLVAGFEWTEVDLEDAEQMKEVYELLNGHYVEDDGAMFRFKYSTSILRWYGIDLLNQTSPQHQRHTANLSRRGSS
jgi:glycylpeptide N-tetradecanoyltransferase